MLKHMLIIIITGIVILGIFAFFTFGLQERFQSNSRASAPSPQVTEKLKVEDMKVGTGSAVKSGDTVVVNYIGTLSDGTKFDSSYDRNQPFETPIGVNKVIKGWDEGIVGMKVGGKRRLTIPPSLGYGDEPQGSIPANSTLIFEIELLGIK